MKKRISGMPKEMQIKKSAHVMRPPRLEGKAENARRYSPKKKKGSFHKHKRVSRRKKTGKTYNSY